MEMLLDETNCSESERVTSWLRTNAPWRTVAQGLRVRISGSEWLGVLAKSAKSD